MRAVPGSVLIVDDDPAVVEALRRVLPQDVEVASAADAATATAMLDERKYCGLVLDMVLETGSGLDVLAHMESRQMQIPTVVITSKMPAYMREMLDEEQVKLVFSKPIDARLLAAVVTGLCGIT